MRILIDLDETLVDLFTPWIEMYNADYDDDLTVDDIKGWKVDKFVIPSCGNKIYRYLYEEGLFASLKPFSGAIEFVKTLQSKGHEIKILTSPPSPVSCKEKVEWVLTHMPFVGKYNIILAHDKHLIRGDVLVDDKPENLEKFPGLSISLKKPWSDMSLEKSGVHYVNDYDEILSIIDRKDEDTKRSLSFLMSKRK